MLLICRPRSEQLIAISLIFNKLCVFQQGARTICTILVQAHCGSGTLTLNNYVCPGWCIGFMFYPGATVGINHIFASNVFGFNNFRLALYFFMTAIVRSKLSSQVLSLCRNVLMTTLSGYRYNEFVQITSPSSVGF